MKNWKKIAYAAGSLGTALSYQAFVNQVQFLYVDVIGLSAGLIGTVWLFYGCGMPSTIRRWGSSATTRARGSACIPYIAFACCRW